MRNNYLASPPLCVAYALAGRMDVDLNSTRSARTPTATRSTSPTSGRARRRSRRRSRTPCARTCSSAATPTSSPATSAGASSTRPRATATPGPTRPTSASRPSSRAWTPSRSRSSRSTARACSACSATASPPTTSRPPGAIKKDSPAGKWLIDNGVEPRDFNSYGSRRGNHEVMIRGTFANVRLRNQLVDREGGFTKHFPDGEEMTIYDAAMSYAEDGRAARRARRQGVRLGLLARLGREGHAAARRPRRASPRASSASTART